jgi:hypothetical protein
MRMGRCLASGEFREGRVDSAYKPRKKGSQEWL